MIQEKEKKKPAGGKDPHVERKPGRLLKRKPLFLLFFYLV
jgi:hypothetical protein